MIRTFVALPIPDNLKEHLGKAIATLGNKNAGVKWVRAENIHITLKFLGNISEDMITPLSQELDRAVEGFPPLHLGFSACGVFPNLKRPRVIWIGMKGDTALLSEIASSVDAACTGFGIPPEKRPFKAHITLGRLKVPSMVDLETKFIEEEFNATRVILYKSELLPQGARYTALHTSCLGQKGGF